MKSTDLPTPYGTVWGASADPAFINDIPVAAPPPEAGLASFELGFPPVNFQPLEAGGLPPSGSDFNGAFNSVTEAIQALQAGFSRPFDAAFSTAIGGYPKGARIPAANGIGTWQSAVDNNIVNPDTTVNTANWNLVQASFTKPFDLNFANSIGGYPYGALIPNQFYSGTWFSMIDNNMVNPDTTVNTAAWNLIQNSFTQPFNVNYANAIAGYSIGNEIPTATLSAGLLPGIWQSLVNNNIQNPDASTYPTQWRLVRRYRLSNNLTIYVGGAGASDTTGNGTAARPFATLQAAWNWCYRNLDLNFNVLTIQLAPGTYGDEQLLRISNQLVGQNAANVIIQGNSAIIQTTQTWLDANWGASVVVRGFNVGSSGGGVIGCATFAYISVSNMIFNNCSGFHFFVASSGYIETNGAYTVIGNAAGHVGVTGSGQFIAAGPFTITVNPACAFPSGFCIVSSNARALWSAVTFNQNVATGPRAVATTSAIIDTGGAAITNPNYFPGNSAMLIGSGGIIT
jgi:hypothetical protein